MKPRRQGGQVLLALLLLGLVLGAGSLLASGALRARAEAQAHARSIAALAEARSALIGYAISYAERHPDAGYGFLPCPDRDNDGSTDLGACGARGHFTLGRLPWRTLGLPELRDGWGECLWYAVAGSIKHNPKPLSLNWDSPGQFEPLGPNREPLRLQTTDGRAVAVLFAPGPAHPGQARAGRRPGTCSGTDGSDLPQYLDHPYPLGGTMPFTVIQGGEPADAAGDTNDLLAWIGVDEIFAAWRRRNDHTAYLDSLLARAAGALTARLADADRDAWLDAHATRIGMLHAAPLPPAAALGLPAPERGEIDQWRDQMHFAACPAGGTCITVTRTHGTEPCSAVLGFAGERVPSGPAAQQRSTATQRADPAQYFEGVNAPGFAQGIPAFEGVATVPHRRDNHPGTDDVILCLP